MAPKPFDVNDYTGTLAAGASIPVHLLEYFSLVLGTGLAVRLRGRGNPAFVLPLNFVWGDGDTALGNVELVNPTVAAITYRIITSTRAFKADSPFNGIIVGADSAGAGPSSNPVQVAGWDGAVVREVLTDTGGRLVVGGAAAHGGAVAGNPVELGAEARSSERAAVANAQAARLVSDLVGKLITLPYANPENVVNGTVQLVAAGSTQLLASAGAGVRNYITSVIVANGGAADQGIILDGATELGRVWVPTQSSVVIELPVPFRGSLAMALNVNIGGTSNDMRFTAVGYKGA